MSLRFAEKTVLVTGAASGIGAAFAQLAAAEGAAALVLVDRDETSLVNLSTELGCPHFCVTGDVADKALWAGLEADVAVRFGGLDLALAGAGIGHDLTPIAELEPDTWSRVVAVNLTGAFLTLRSSLRLIRDDGAVVLISSSMGVKPSPGTAGYGASKAALIHLARIAALEAAPRGIRVNAISPGGVETALFRGNRFFDTLVEQTGGERAAFDALASRTPLGRYAKAAETAELIAFLMSEQAGQMTGANMVADAGMTL